VDKHEDGPFQLIRIPLVDFLSTLAKMFSASTNVDLTSSQLGLYAQEIFRRPVAAEMLQAF
jgi:hypothetical protein